MARCMRSYAVFFLLCDATGKREVIIITEEQIQNKIYRYLVEQNEHIILEHMPDHYYNLFWNSISILYEGGILTTAKSVEKFCNKLQLRGSYNRDKCLQGISEMVFWVYAIRRNYSFKIDKQLHTKNEKNNSDVDIQIVKDGYTFNIEVKTPNQVKKTDESILNITIPFRSFERKDIQDEEVRKINRDISQAIINNSQGRYTAYEQTKIDDNKVIEYLRSGQTKFTYEPNSINVLALSVPSQQMDNYWGYLYNPFSGIFTDQFSGKFFDKKKNEIKHSEFDKVDVVLLTNIVEGHKRIVYEFDSWKLENYCSIFCINPFSQRTMKHCDVDVYKYLLDILPNDTNRFEKERDERNLQGEKLGIPTDPIFFSEYLYNHYYKLR